MNKTAIPTNLQGVFLTGTPPKTSKYKKVNLGASRPIYVNVDSPNLGFTYFYFFRGVPVKKNTLYIVQNV